MFTEQTHKYIQTDKRHLIQQSLPHMARVTSCYHVTFPFLHPSSSSILTNRRVNSFISPKGSGLLLIHKMTLVWSLFFCFFVSLRAEITASTHYIARNAFRFVVFVFSSVDPLPAFRSSTVAGNLVLALHGVKLVVETQLENRGGGNVSLWASRMQNFDTYIHATV